MSTLSITDWVTRAGQLAAEGQSFFFVIDFELQRPRLWPLEKVGLSGPRFCFPGHRCPSASGERTINLDAKHLDEAKFRAAFDLVQRGLHRGDSFLTNLTFATPVRLSSDLDSVFNLSDAKYRILLPGEFVCFSPETFVTVDRRGYIESRPMKGTALNTPEDREALLKSPKEVAEHATIVDLIRADLSRVARRVRVTDYRYLRSISPDRGGLVQTSSKIGGWLPEDWRERLGEWLLELLPAGSVSGAPKPATLELIRRAEAGPRGYYCGVAGYFDGQCLDTCVMIRFIEQTSHGVHYFRSGGGITAYSKWADEYAELRAKIQIPQRAGAFSLH